MKRLAPKRGFYRGWVQFHHNKKWVLWCQPLAGVQLEKGEGSPHMEAIYQSSPNIKDYKLEFVGENREELTTR